MIINFNDQWIYETMSVELTLLLATVLHYFHIFTFHTEHYWICIFGIMIIESAVKQFKEWWRK